MMLCGLGDVFPSGALVSYCQDKYAPGAIAFDSLWSNAGFQNCVKQGGASYTLPPPDYSGVTRPGMPAGYDPLTGTCGNIPCGNPTLPGPQDFPVEDAVTQPMTPLDYGYAGAVATGDWIKKNGALLLAIGAGVFIFIMSRGR